MEIIFVSKFSHRNWRFHVGRLGTSMLMVFVPALAGLMFYLGYQSVPESPDPRPELYAAAWEAEVLEQRLRVDSAIRDAEESLDALALRLGEMQAHIIRLDALGSRLVGMAKLDEGEFDFDEPPARGGSKPAADLEPNEIPDFMYTLDMLAAQLEDREPKLRAVEGTLMSRNLQAQVQPSGRPVRRGWISSYFGYRTDPITGRRGFHNGVDFSGRRGSDVIAVAAGVVVWAGRNGGLGNVVELDHGNGYTTRYAHNKELFVKVGDKVEKGQKLASLGSSGRSTGPHVHFEVRRNGKAVNPIELIRASR